MGKYGRNAPCPCGSGKKFKHCCRGQVDWGGIFAENANPAEHLTARGKNLWFLEVLGDALQLDRLTPKSTLKDFKRSVTAEAVRKIYEAIPTVWPSSDDLTRVLALERERQSGLYLGFYDPDRILSGVTRHCLYSDSILIIDPFIDPRGVRDEYNPVLHPDQYRPTALRWVWMWLQLAPWVDAGMVRFIRTPGGFDTRAELESMRIAQERYEADPELTKELERVATEAAATQFESYREQILLGIPDDLFRRTIRQQTPDASDEFVEELVAYLNRRRDQNPYFIEAQGSHRPGGEMLHFTLGTSLEMAKLTANQAGAHLITDMGLKWKEIEIDRREAGVQPDRWTPFAKAFQELPFNYLNNVPLPAALRLREEGRLEDMRAFLGRTWRMASAAEDFADRQAEDFAEELAHKVREADQEWDRIGRDLMKWLGAETGAALLAMATIGTGGAAWVGAGLAALATTSILYASEERQAFRNAYPAGFFLDLQREGETNRGT